MKGDSFILAFFTPAHALDYALASQQRLMEADWPEPLLESPDAAQVGARQGGGLGAGGCGVGWGAGSRWVRGRGSRWGRGGVGVWEQVGAVRGGGLGAGIGVGSWLRWAVDWRPGGDTWGFRQVYRPTAVRLLPRVSEPSSCVSMAVVSAML